MKDLFMPNLFTLDTVKNIVYSSYIQEYYIYFALLLSGYIAINYFLGYLIGKIPYVNKLFIFQRLLSFIVLLPLLIILVKIIFNIDSANIFLDKSLFIALFSSLSILLLIYAGTKGLLRNDYGIIEFFHDYTFTIMIIAISSYYYYQKHIQDDIYSVTRTMKSNIHKHMMYLQKTNNADYRLAELIVNYYVQSIDGYTNRLNTRERKIIHDFNVEIENYDNKYNELSKKIIKSDRLIKDLEVSYKHKINIVDKEIDEEKLRLKSIYEEWRNNVVNNIDNLNKLSKKYSLEIETLENNKDLFTHLQNKLKLIKQKSSATNIELLKVNDSISKNINNIKHTNKLFEKLSNDIKKDNTSISSIDIRSSKNSTDITKQIEKINKIKTIQVQLIKNKKSLDLIKSEIDMINKKLNFKKEDNNSTLKKVL
jgi:hypothetical protein